MLEALSRIAFDIGRIDPRSARIYDWTIVEATYPVLDVIFNHAVSAPLRVKLYCTEWDELPPSIELLDAGGRHLTAVPHNLSGVFNNGPHPRTGRPFICMRGSREYHTYDGHVGDLWENYRGQLGMDLGGIVLQLWRVWKKGVG